MGSCCRSTGCVDNTIENSCIDGKWSTSTCSSRECSVYNFGSCCTPSGICLKNILSSDCNQAKGVFSTDDCNKLTCASPLTNSNITNGACCKDQQCSDVSQDEDCDAFLPGLTCAEAELTADTCIQGNCFKKTSQVLCSKSDVCYNGECFTPLTGITEFFVESQSFKILKIDVYGSCVNVTANDSTMAAQFYFRNNLVPTRNIFNYQTKSEDVVILCPPNSVWYMQAINPSVAKIKVKIQTKEVVIQEMDKEIFPLISSSIILLPIFCLQFILLLLSM